MVKRVALFFITIMLLFVPYYVWAKEIQANKADTDISFAGSQSEEQKNSESQLFYKNSGKEGWWWYKDYVKEQKKEEKKKQQTEQAKQEPKQEPKTEIKPLQEYSFQELMQMHPEELKKIYEHYLNLAVQKPTEENVYNFYNIQDVVRKKSLAFANVSGYVWQKYPELSTEKDVPIVGPGITQKARLTMQEIQSYVRSVNQDFGLIVFVAPGCHYCETQLGILKYAERDGVYVKVVDIAQNLVAKAKFGIETTPTIILVDKNSGQYMPISSGVVSLEDIYIRIEKAMRVLRGEKPEHYGIYEYQKGGGLDVTTPPPLWKDKKVNKGGK